MLVFEIKTYSVSNFFYIGEGEVFGNDGEPTAAGGNAPAVMN